MPELLSPFAPLHPWLLKRCARNLRVVRNPDDPFSLHHEGQEVEILSRSASEESDIDIMLSRIDGPPDDRWVSWRRSVDYRADCRHFATRAMMLDALAAHGHRLPWALGGIWSALTDEQAARVTAEAVRAVGADPKCPAGIIPIGVLKPWLYVPGHEWIRRAVIGNALRSIYANDKSEHADKDAKAIASGALLWEQITPPEKADV